MPTVDQLQPGQWIAVYATGEWLEITGLPQRDPDGYYLLVPLSDGRTARLAPELQVEVR